MEGPQLVPILHMNILRLWEAKMHPQVHSQFKGKAETRMLVSSSSNPGPSPHSPLESKMDIRLKTL